MEYGVGAPPHRDVQGERVVDGVARDDVPGGHITLDHIRKTTCGPIGEFVAQVGVCQRRAIERQPEAENLGQTVHTVRGEHAATRATRWARVVFEGLESFEADLVRAELTDPLEHAGEVDRLAVGHAARRHRAAADEHRRNIEARRRHQHARYDLVAVGYAHHAVEAVRGDHRLDTVRDQLAARQRVAHAAVTHRDAVVDRDGVHLERDHSRRADGVFDPLSKTLQVNVSGHDLHERVHDRDERLVHVLIFEAGGFEQGAVRRPLDPGFDPVRTHWSVSSARTRPFDQKVGFGAIYVEFGSTRSVRDGVRLADPDNYAQS